MSSGMSSKSSAMRVAATEFPVAGSVDRVRKARAKPSRRCTIALPRSEARHADDGASPRTLTPRPGKGCPTRRTPFRSATPLGERSEIEAVIGGLAAIPPGATRS